MRETIHLTTAEREVLVDITSQVADVVARSGVREGLVNVYAQGATGAIMIQENWDDSVQTDVINLLRQMIPRGVWLHDRQDGNGDSHLKAGHAAIPRAGSSISAGSRRRSARCRPSSPGS